MQENLNLQFSAQMVEAVEEKNLDRLFGLFEDAAEAGADDAGELALMLIAAEDNTQLAEQYFAEFANAPAPEGEEASTGLTKTYGMTLAMAVLLGDFESLREFLLKAKEVKAGDAGEVALAVLAGKLEGLNRFFEAQEEE